MTPARMRELRITDVLQAYEEGRAWQYKSSSASWIDPKGISPTDLLESIEARVKPREPRSWWLVIFPHGEKKVLSERPSEMQKHLPECEIVQVFEKLP